VRTKAYRDSEGRPTDDRIVAGVCSGVGRYLGLDPVLMAGANSSGGVLGKMVSPQNLAIAAAAVGLAGKEGDIFRKVIGWSLFLLALMCVIVWLQSTPVLEWMVP